MIKLLLVLTSLLILNCNSVLSHGDHGTAPKLIFVIIKPMNETVESLFKETKFGKNLDGFNTIKLSSKMINENLLLNLSTYCNSALICQPIWFINQLNNHHSALISWPGDLTFNNTNWPYYSFYADRTIISLRMTLLRLDNWMSHSNTNFGSVYLDDFSQNYLQINQIKALSKDLNDLLHRNHDNNFIFLKSNKTASYLYTNGIKFRNISRANLTINSTDFCGIVNKVLQWKHGFCEGSNLVSLIVNYSNDHKLSYLTYTIVTILITLASVLCLVIIICAIQQTQAKRRRQKLINRVHLSNLASKSSIPMSNIVSTSSDNNQTSSQKFSHNDKSPEHDLLLDIDSSEDELLNNHPYNPTRNNKLNFNINNNNMSEIDLN